MKHLNHPAGYSNNKINNISNKTTLKKIHHLPPQSNEMYILELLPNIIITNDNYYGLRLLNYSLKSVYNIPIKNKICIYSVYKRDDYSAIALYDDENQELIVINLTNNKIDIIKLPSALRDLILSPHYYWHENTFILTTSRNIIFYQLCFTSYSLQEISYQTAQELAPSYITFWKESQKHSIINTYPHSNSFIFEKDLDTVGFFNHIDNTTTLIQNFSKGWHDIEYDNDFFAFIHEDKIELLHNKNKIILRPKPHYYFSRARFLDTKTIAVLSKQIPYHLFYDRQSFIETYTINFNYLPSPY